MHSVGPGVSAAPNVTDVFLSAPHDSLLSIYAGFHLAGVNIQIGSADSFTTISGGTGSPPSFQRVSAVQDGTVEFVNDAYLNNPGTTARQITLKAGTLAISNVGMTLDSLIVDAGTMTFYSSDYQSTIGSLTLNSGSASFTGWPARVTLGGLTLNGGSVSGSFTLTGNLTKTGDSAPLGAAPAPLMWPTARRRSI